MGGMSEIVEVVVVGAGAAGIVAAGRAAELGKRVVLLEKNDRLGMKILISGGGKCNLTHDGTMEELRAKFRPLEARFLKPAFYKFTNQQFLTILHRRGLPTYVRPDGRVFPVEPADAKTVVGVLSDYVRNSGVVVRSASPVVALALLDSLFKITIAGGEELLAKRLILSVGGSSYPATGTTGDGWRWAREMGHKIVPLRAALAPISLVDAHPEWSGVALRDVVLKARDGKRGKEFVRFSGDLLYTHKGISGPVTLGISRDVAEHMAGDTQAAPFIEADLLPSMAFEKLRDDLRASAAENPRRATSALITGRLPARLLPHLFALSGVDPELRSGQLPAKALTRLVTLLKEWPLGEPSSVPLERGEVVAGGIALDEVNPQTMESLIVPGLFFCGEILDLAGPVGGYNLQAAWSTGYVAGSNA
jgi:predicted Rossmann fold flavoprotein